MHPMLNIAVRAARKAGGIITRFSDQVDTLKISSKAENDFVSEVDQLAEQAIVQILLKAYPNHSILAEESGVHQGNEFEWIIDPLDGTTNFLHGVPHYAVSIGLRHKGRLEVAVVYDPFKQEMFTASRGSGAQLNGKRIRVTKRTNLKGALLGTGIPFRELQILDTYLAMLRALLPETAGIRRAGSAALDLAYVAAGRLDGFWEFGLKPWDMAAGVLLIEEAGGIVCDFRGGFDYFASGNIVTANPKVLKAMIQAIRPCLV
ncbi:MAG: inositol-1-monophosphatase [Gammaproteobacteria bacterium]|nr:inositol-1-monophosphatase [Gammaproteobacteria bacterium]